MKKGTTLKHLPTKPTFVKSIQRKPHIRLQHYNPDKERDILNEKILDMFTKSRDVYVQLRLFGIKKDHTLKDFFEYVNEPTRLHFYETAHSTYIYPLAYYLKNKYAVDKEIFKEGIRNASKNEEIIHDDLLKDGMIFESFNFLYNIDNDYKLTVKSLEEMLNDIKSANGKTLLEVFNKYIIDGIPQISAINGYVNELTPHINTFTPIFKRLIDNNFRITNSFEFATYDIYNKTQWVIEKLKKTHKFEREYGNFSDLFRGMLFVGNYIEINSPKLMSTTLDPEIALEFSGLLDDNIKMYNNYDEYLKNGGVEIIGRDKLHKHVNIKKEKFGILEHEGEKKYGYIIHFEPKSTKQIFLILTGSAWKAFEKLNKKSFDLEYYEDEVIVFF